MRKPGNNLFLMIKSTKTGKNLRILMSVGVFGIILVSGCSTVKENGEPNVTNTTVITNDEQRRAIYERGGTVSPQNANPIPTSEELGLDERSSEINRKRNIEEGSNNTNAPSNT